LENICSYTICDDEDGSGLVYVYVNNYRDFKVILSDHCVNAYMRGWCLSNSQRWRERCRSAEADWADVDTEGLVVAADVVGGDVDDR